MVDIYHYYALSLQPCLLQIIREDVLPIHWVVKDETGIKMNLTLVLRHWIAGPSP